MAQSGPGLHELSPQQSWDAAQRRQTEATLGLAVGEGGGGERGRGSPLSQALMPNFDGFPGQSRRSFWFTHTL